MAFSNKIENDGLWSCNYNQLPWLVKSASNLSAYSLTILKNKIIKKKASGENNNPEATLQAKNF